MPQSLVLASGSEIRATMLRNAGVSFEVRTGRVDENAIRAPMQREGATGADIAAMLAEHKARQVSAADPRALVLGCDQVLEFDGCVFSKPDSPQHLREQLSVLNGQTHMLYSAAVICEAGQTPWRHVGKARMTMRQASDEYLDGYVSRNWSSVRHSVGGYHLEAEGVRLFQSVRGDYFTVLGLPLIEVLGFLTIRGILAR